MIYQRIHSTVDPEMERLVRTGPMSKAMVKKLHGPVQEGSWQ